MVLFEMTLIAVKMTKCLALETVESWISITSSIFIISGMLILKLHYWENGRITESEVEAFLQP